MPAAKNPGRRRFSSSTDDIHAVVEQAAAYIREKENGAAEQTATPATAQTGQGN